MTTKYRQLHILICLLFAFTINCQSPPLNGQDEPNSDNHMILNVSQIWGYGFLAGFGISALGFITALIIVCVKNIASDGCFEMTIKFLFSLAFGALLGDAMIHILPDAYSIEGSDPRIVAAIFILSILFFLILERLFEACGITHQHWHSNDCHDDHQGAIKHHNHPNKIQNQDQSSSIQDGTTVPNITLSNNMIMQESLSHSHKCKQAKQHHHIHHNYDHKQQNHKHDQKSQQKNEHSNCQGHQHEHENSPNKDQQTEEDKSCLQNLKGKGTAGYMNLLGSIIHNFMDGLALGVAFATGDPKSFVPILVAIIAHEIPRQMGDVAILMTNRFNGMQTVLCNGFVNILSLLGVIIGLAITNLTDVVKMYILVFVAGNFIYIAADIWRHLFKNSGFSKNLLQFFGFGIGVGSMYIILLLQSNAQR